MLQMRGIVKQFPGARALDGVDLEIRAGEVHCLLGQNGAGKSTLIKVLAGAHQPDEGEILLDGAPVTISHPVAGLKLGIATMYQELDVVDGLSVAENIYLGHELAVAGFSQRHAATANTRAILKRLGHGDISPHREVGRLSAAGKQIVSMARALSHDARVIVMDEPSAVLDSEEVENLFRVVRELTSQGVAVVYISHRLDEIRQIGDRITVLKDGRTVATGLPVADHADRGAHPSDDRAHGRVRDPAAARGRRRRPGVLRVDGLSLRGAFRDVSFDVRAGEVVGLAGLVGSGRTEILETIFGARKRTAGSVRVGDDALRAGAVSDAVRAGIGLCPEERKSQGLILDEPVYRNITLSTFSRTANGVVPRRAGRAPCGQGADRCARRAARRTPTAAPGPCRAATSRRSCSRAGWCTAAASCCSTSPPAASTSARAPRSTRSSPTWRAAAPPSSWSPARSPRSSACPTGSSWSPKGAWSTTGPRPVSTSTACSTSSWKEVPRERAGDHGSSRPGRGRRGGPGRRGESRAGGCCAGRRGRNLGLVIALIAICVVGVATAGDRFASIDNVLTILRLASVFGVLSIGMTFVIIGGGIDLSIGSVVGLASVWASTLATQTLAKDTNWGVMVLCALAVGLGAGLVNGVLVAYGKVVAFIATLAMLVAARGLAEIIANRQTQVVKVQGFLDFFRGDLIGIPTLVWIFVVVAVAGWILLNRTTFGRRTIAVGGNPEAARLAGIKVKRHTMYLYALSGLAAGIGGVMMLGRTTAGSSTNGFGYELDVIAAVVVGGTLLAGGRGVHRRHRPGRPDLLDAHQRVHAEQPVHLGPVRGQGRDHRRRRPAPAADRRPIARQHLTHARRTHTPHHAVRSRRIVMSAAPLRRRWLAVAGATAALALVVAGCTSNTPTDKATRAAADAPAASEPGTTSRATWSRSVSPPPRPTTAGWAPSPRTRSPRPPSTRT